ncbi:hypothetical protein JNJ66_03885 [Candidatus Saccharibacteria bacterium]|nr:hypothetical protein [Candidatus Saccharibacteria bacterium]
MNTAALQPLAGRWPEDVVPTLDDPQRLFSTPGTQSVYEGTVQVSETDSQSILQFATDNGMTYQKTVVPQTGDVPPAWLGPTLNTTMPVFAHEVQGQLFGFPVTMLLAYTAASTQQSNAENLNLARRSIVRVSLPKVFPQIVLESNKNDKSAVSTMPTSFKTDQKLGLEGAFADYFDLYAPRGLQINTLTLLAPNFMQQLMDSSAMFDVEFLGTDMYFVTKDSIYSPHIMEQALGILETQLTYLKRLLESWDYQPNNPPYDRLEVTQWQGAVTKIGPLRLSPGVLLLLILGGFVVFGIVVAALPDQP